MSVEQQEQSEGVATVAPDVTPSVSPNGSNGHHRPFSRDAARATVGKVSEEWVDVPEMGEGSGVWVRGLTARAKDRFEQSLVRGKGKATRMDWDNARAKLSVLCCYDGPQPGGARMFQDGDESWLGDVAASALERIYDVATRLSGMSSDPKAPTVEDAVGFFESGPKDISS